MNYLKRAVELSQKSFDAGEFPAGAILVSKSGKVYESKPSVPHNHGETMLIDMAIEAEGAPLTGATIYASMQPCLMCASKMYWAGVEAVEYAIPKTQVRSDYAYESDLDTTEVATKFYKPLKMTHQPELLSEALEVYSKWVRKVES